MHMDMVGWGTLLLFPVNADKLLAYRLDTCTASEDQVTHYYCIPSFPYLVLSSGFLPCVAITQCASFMLEM
jgi:hypothetical protein